MASFRFSQLVRQFGTTAVQHGKLVQPPIHLFGIEGRYATALFSAASKQNQLDVVEKEMKSLQDLLKKDLKLKDFVNNPSLKRSQKKAVLGEVLKKQKFSEISINLVDALAENGRIRNVSSVLSSFAQLMSAHRGEVICNVTTAKPLDSAAMNELKAALQGLVKKGETLQLATEVDPSLIGGMVVSIGDRYVDMSMATKIKNYTNVLKQAV